MPSIPSMINRLETPTHENCNGGSSYSSSSSLFYGIRSRGVNNHNHNHNQQVSAIDFANSYLLNDKNNYSSFSSIDYAANAAKTAAALAVSNYRNPRPNPLIRPLPTTDYRNNNNLSFKPPPPPSTP